MDFDKIQCFVSAAKNLNFSRTAEELFLSQPTVTAKINSLEIEIGAKLFIRNKHSVKLTAIGKYLYDEFSYLLNYYHTVEKNVNNMVRTNDSLLRIGYHGPYNWASVIDIIRAFRKEHAEIFFEIHVEGWGVLREAVLNQKLDIIFIESSELGNSPQLDSLYLKRGLSAVALPSDHPLAKRVSVNVAEIKNDPILMANNTFAPRSISSIHARMTRSGLDMSKAIFVDHFENALSMTASGLGNTYLPRTFKVANDTSVSYVNVDSEEMYLDYSLAWLKENENKNIKLFCNFMKAFMWEIE
jgi:DNA-binding transcriptional LysR family regulator